MSKFIMVKTVQRFSHVYAIEVEDDFNVHGTDFLQLIQDEELEELSQNWLGEEVVAATECTKEEIIQHAQQYYYGSWSDDAIMTRLVNQLDEPAPTVESDWKCPINHPGCTSNCGSYGCGN